MHDAEHGGGARLLPHPRRTFALAMLLYLSVVHGASIDAYPVGRDFAAMANPERLPGWGATLFAWELRTFAGHAVPYRVLNLSIVYGIMLAVFFLVRNTVRGPWWMGSLAATLLMANLAKSEAVLYMSGVVDLLPALLLLTALAIYAADCRECRWWKYLIALGFGTAAIFAHPANVCLALLVPLYEAHVATPEERNWRRPLPFVLLGALSLATDPSPLTGLFEDAGRLLPPLHYVLYPVGLLPETAQYFREHPPVLWASIAGEIALAALLAWKARHPALRFGIVGAFATGWTWCVAPVDPVDLSGGGQLLAPAALLSVAFAAFCHAIWRHPKWQRPVILLTTMLCVLFFGLQIREVLDWRGKGNEVRAFQQRIEAEGRSAIHAQEAPLHPHLLESIRYDTPFSTPFPGSTTAASVDASAAESMLPLVESKESQDDADGD